jgi:glycosyltransferase involved in cell wall biosynthesis
MGNPKMVSVILPVYNCERYVKDAIESILDQTYKNFELIVVDDGSTDNSIKIIERFRSSSVKIIRQENLGAGAARNSGLEIAGGEYFAFLDSDDLWLGNKLELQMEQIVQPGAPDMIFGYVKEFSGGNPALTHAPLADAQSLRGIHPISILVSRENFMRVGLFNPIFTVGEFIDWYARAKNQKLSELMMPEILAYRRVHEGNLDRLKRNNINQYASVLKAALDRKRNL